MDEPSITPAQTEEAATIEQENSSILTATAPEGEQETQDAVNPGEEPPKSADDPATGDEPPGDKAGDGDQEPPESYSDFELPEGVELDAQLLEQAVPLFKELGLNQEQAQKLVDFQVAQIKEGQQRQTDSFSQLMNDWQEQSKNDKEFGGEHFDENVSTAMLAVQKFGTPEFKQLMEDHGVGNHPEMIRFMWNIGKQLKEDQPANLGQGPTQQKDRISILYGPNSK